jgi:hypothetical protein
MNRLLVAPALAGLACFWPLAAQAQFSVRDQPGDAASMPRQVIAVNPFLPLFGYFQGEYERRVRENVSVALAGSYVRFDDYFTNVDAKLRLYPQDTALEGLGLAAGLGVGAVRRRGSYTVCDPLGENCREAGDGTTESAPTFSIEAQYQWLLGRSRATAITVGGGAKRYFLSEEKARGIERVLPTLRLTIGYAFR